MCGQASPARSGVLPRVTKAYDVRLTGSPAERRLLPFIDV
jgi:hypothetical protein